MEEQQDYKVTHKFFIAGVQFHEMKNVIDDLSEGDNLLLVPEPSNKFDPNAVCIELVTWGDPPSVMLGFVPKKFSSEVAAALEVGKSLECVLVKLNKSAKTWEQAEVEIREVFKGVFEEAGPDIGDGSDYDEGCREETE
jgi:hypothetical protein